MEATLTGRNGLRVVAPVDQASKKESDCATTQNQLTVADRVTVLVPTQGNVKLDSVQVKTNICLKQLLSFPYHCPSVSELFFTDVTS